MEFSEEMLAACEKAIRERQNRQRRKWYGQKPEEKKIADRIRYAKSFLAKHGMFVAAMPPEGEWNELQKKAILKAVEIAAEEARHARINA